MAVVTRNSLATLKRTSGKRLISRAASGTPGGPARFYLISKRAFDLTASLMLMPFLLPAMALGGLALWIENPGPILFTQLRTGRGGHRFRMYKLRSMVTNAEALKPQLRHMNELTWPDFKISNDPRVTRVGRILRKTSVDELPQFFNVIRGEMSLVGPRPTSFSANTYEMWHTERLEVPPGITGLWQVSGRGGVDFDERLRLDIEYIRKRSFWFDIKLILRTVTAVAKSRGAW